jgi:hypothetical protein
MLNRVAFLLFFVWCTGANSRQLFEIGMIREMAVLIVQELTLPVFGIQVPERENSTYVTLSLDHPLES